ncbi:fibrous sheath-interacting protein 2 [Varanus komodoensis]|uniref:fibrous sheath-interacting protein 2 n=1 Tax=Varanus komodoensis TaxID=61221 RepID=UPI001CF78265|nr:fibrous sheath-interacting protein 2 [Varanus komodoensis]
MAYPNRGLLKAAMGHYLTESARTALEALEPDEDVIEMGPRKQMPTVGPNQLLEMPLFAKLPFLPGSNTMFYTTNLGEKLYQPTATFDLNDPYCKVMAPRYNSLHDPHLRAYHKRKDNLRRLKRAGHITDRNKVVCTLKEFNEYRHYLTSLKLDFEKHYIREQKMLEKQVTKLQDTAHIPEGADTSRYREWLLKEERPTKQEQEHVMRSRYLELINQELAKLEQLAEENRRLALAQDDKKQQGVEKKKQLLLRRKMEEEWRKKEMMLLVKIGNEVKREGRIEEQRQKSEEEKLRRKQAVLERKMAYHLKKLEEKFCREGLPATDKLFPTTVPDQGPPAEKPGATGKGSAETPRESTELAGKKSTGLFNNKGEGPQKGPPASDLFAPAASCSSRLREQDELLRTRRVWEQDELLWTRRVREQDELLRTRRVWEQDELLRICWVWEQDELLRICWVREQDELLWIRRVREQDELLRTCWVWEQDELLRLHRVREQDELLRLRRVLQHQRQIWLLHVWWMWQHEQQSPWRLRFERQQQAWDQEPHEQAALLVLSWFPLAQERGCWDISTLFLLAKGILCHIPFCQSELGNPSSKERCSSKKKRVEKNKAEHVASTSQDNEDSEPSSYLRHLSTLDQPALQDSLRGKVSALELNGIIQNIMTWVVSAVTSILYPALTKFEERVRTRVYTISEESVLSSESSSSSCSSCNEGISEAYRNLPSSARKVSFTDTSIKPTAQHQTSGKPTSLLSSKSSCTSFSKSAPMSAASDIFKGKFKRGKTAIFFSPSKHSGLLSTTASMRSSKSDSYIFQMRRAASDTLEKAVASCHSKRKSILPRVPLSKADSTNTATTDTERIPFAAGEHGSPQVSADQREDTDSRDLKSVFSDLKDPLVKITSIFLDDIFKKVLGDLGFVVSSISISAEVLLESISESLLGSHPAGSPGAGSVSRIASFVANDLVESVLNKLHSTAQKKYMETISRDSFATECKALCMVAAGKHAFPDPSFWRAWMPLSLESIHGIAEEIIQLIVDKLQVFSSLSQTKVSQFELCAKIKALGVPLEQLYAAIPLHTVESEAAHAIVRDTMRKVISKTVASSETNLLQYVEEMISSILGYIQRQMSPEGAIPTRESSVLIQLINDVFNDLSLEKLCGVSAAAKTTASPKKEGELVHQDILAVPEVKATTVTTLFTADRLVRKSLPPVNIPGMVIYSEAETEEKDRKEADGTSSLVNREQKVLVVGEGQDTVRHESFGLESQQRSQPHPKSSLQGAQGFQDQDRKKGPKGLEKTERYLEKLVPDAIFSSLEAQQTTTVEWTLEQALEKMEKDFKEQEQSPIVQLVRDFLNEMFRHVWAEQPIWPPRAPPSLAHMSTNRQQAEEGPVAKGQPESSRLGPVSDADVHALAGDLVRTAFQKISRATQTDPQDISRRPSLVITDILPLNMPTDAAKGLPAVHFRDPEMPFPSGHLQETTRPLTNVTDDPAKTTQHEHSLSFAKSELTNDLRQTFIAKLETFVTSKIESQLCLDVKNLKTSISSDFSSAIQQEFKRILANQCGAESIFNSYSNSILAEKQKVEPALSLSQLNLRSHAQEVAKMMLKSLKHGLDKGTETPVIFSESIAASQIISMVLAVLVPHENLTESQHPSSRKQSVLEKLFRKNPAYKKDLQFQIQNTVELFLNEIYQTIMLEMGSSLTEKLCAPGGKAAAEDTFKKVPSRAAVAKSDASLVSSELVDIILEDLRSGLAAGLNMKGTLSARFHSLLWDLVQGTVEPFAQLISRGAKAKCGSHSLDTPSQPKVEQSRKMARCSMKLLPDLKDFSSEGITKYLVDNILLRLNMFAEEKLESELALAPQQEKEHQSEGRYAASTQGAGQGHCRTHGPQAPATKAGSYRDKARLAVQASQSNLKLCAEKLTCTILTVIQKDLEREMLSCQGIIPYEENASANEIMNDLLQILSVQIALTENEVQKRVLKRIFQRQPAGQSGGFPLLARVEDVLSQVTQRILGDLGHLPSFNNETQFLSSESKSSSYNGMTETISQANTAGVAGDIVEGVLSKMYSVVVGTLFSSSGSQSALDSLSSNRLSNEAPCLTGKSDLQKMTLALSQLQPPPRSLGEELVQSVLNKIACFAASNLEEVLPSSMGQKRKSHALLQHEIQGMGGMLWRPRLFSDGSEGSLMRVSLSKSDLTVYAKDVVSNVLGTIIDGFKMEDYHRTILRVNTLSSEQISIASDLVHSVVHDLHTNDIQISHLHKHTSVKHGKVDGLPSAQMCFQFELSTKEARGKSKGLFYEDFSSYLKQVLPKNGILREIYEQQPLSDATINESLEMLQVAESIISEVLMRTRDLEASVCTLRKIPGEVSERLFCYGFQRAGAPALVHSDSRAEIDSIARDIVASVFESVQKCLACSVPATHEKDSFLGRKSQAVPKGSGKMLKHRFTQPEFPFYNVSLKSAMDTIDKIAKETVECVFLMLETFVARHFRQDFKCNFLEIVKFPLEGLSFAQPTRSLDSLLTQVGSVAEATVESFRSQLQGAAGKEALPTLGSSHNFLDFSKLGSAITRECIETAIQQVQVLHSELNVYANNAVSGILEIIKRTLDRELAQKEATLFSSSSESLVLSETISVMLDRCNESLTEITSELMLESLQREVSRQGLARELAASPGVRTTSRKRRRVDLRERFPRIKAPGMVVYSEEETEVHEGPPSQFPSVFKYAERGCHVTPEMCKGLPRSTPAPGPRPPARRRRSTASGAARPDVLEDELLPRQSSVPEGSIFGKLFKQREDVRLTWPEHLRKAGPLPHHEPLARASPLGIPEGSCLSAACPLKLGHTAETIVSALLSESGLENEGMAQAGCCGKAKHHFPTLADTSPLGTSGSSALRGSTLERHSLLSRWEGRLSSSSEQTDLAAGEGGLLMREGSSLLSKWESRQCVFRCRSPDPHGDLELLACAHVPDPCEIQLLASHIVLSVIKELIVFQSREALDEKASRSPLPAWKHELIQSESRWLQERIWRCTYLPPCRKQSSCLEVFWEPLTQAVVSRVLLSVSNSSAQDNMREKNGLFDNSFSMFCSVDPCCPAHGLGSPHSPLLNIEELAFRLSEVILGILREQHVLQESMSRKGFQGRKTPCMYVPLLRLADFDDVYHPLVKEVSNLLSMEIEMRGRYVSNGRAGDGFSQQQRLSSRCVSRASRGDCRGSSNTKWMACRSPPGQVAHRTKKLSCIASNLDNFIRSLKSRESKQLVNQVLHIILDSLWSEQPQSSFAGSVSHARPPNAACSQGVDLPGKRRFLCSSVCPHAYRLSSNTMSGDLGLSPKSVVLLDVVSEKLIRTLLDKCLSPEHFTGTMAFDESPEDELFYDEKSGLCNESELLQDSRRGQSDASVFTYDIHYAEEPWAEAQSGLSSYESALDSLAHTLVKPVMTQLSLSLEEPGRMRPIPKKAAGFMQPTSRKVHGQSLGKKHVRYGKTDGYSSFPRGKKQESKGPIPGRRLPRRSLREREDTVLETAVRHRTFHSRPAASTGKSTARKPRSVTCRKKTYRREVVTMMGHGDQPGFVTVYSALFLKEVISLLLIKIFSLCSRLGKDSSVNLHELSTLFVNALVEEFRQAGIGILQAAEEKMYFPLVDSQTVDKITDSILREFGFQLAADGSIGRDMESLAERAAEIILTEILDYQLPPHICRRLPQSAYENVQAGPIIQRIEHRVCFPKVPEQRQSPPTYITILSQKYLERVINQLLAHFFPPSEDISQKQEKRDMSGPGFDELSSYMITEVMKSIAKHKIWVAKRDDQCQLHSEKEVQGMVDSVYKNVLTRSGSQTAIQEDIKHQNATLVEHITSFIIQEITKHHLQTFLSKDGTPSGSPDPEALSENIVRTVLDSISKPSVSQANVFPAKYLEEIVSRVLSKIFGISVDKKEVGKEQCDAELGKVAKRLASSISLPFGQASNTEAPSSGGLSLGAPLADVMDDVVDSVCKTISRERERTPKEGLGHAGDSSILENIKRLVEKGISDHFLHPLFSGDLSNGFPSPAFHEDVAENARAESEQSQEAKEGWAPFSTFLSTGFLRDLISGLLSKIFPSMPPRDAASPLVKRLPSESDLNNLATQLLDDVRMKLLKHEIRVTEDAHPEECEYSEEDVQNMTDSLCSKIIQRSGSLEAVQRDVKSKSTSLIDRIAGFLVGDILQKHVQPFVSAEDPHACSRAAVGDSSGGMAMHQTEAQPLDFRQTGWEQEEVMGFISRARQDYPVPTPSSASPPGQSRPSSTLISKTAGWTIHHVKLGDGEPQTTQVEEGADVYSSSFLKDIFSGLVTKLLSSTTSACTPEEKSSEVESSAKHLVESILKEFAKSPVKVLQIPEGGQTFPTVGKTEIAKIIHASLCSILLDWGSGAPICTDKGSDHTLAERLARAIKKEICSYQIQGTSTEACQSPALKPFELGEMAKKVLMEVRKINTPSQTVTPYPLLVSQRFIHDVLAVLLARFLPLPTADAAPADTEDQCAEFDFIHMKLLSKVMAELAKDKDAKVQYLDRVQPNRVISQTVANSIYSNLLPEFGTTATVEKCIKAGCTVLSERIADFVIKEISGHQMQTYFMEELNRQQKAEEAERELEQQYSPGPLEEETPLQSHLRGLSSIFIEEVAAKLLSKVFHALPLEDMDAGTIASMKEVAKKIINSLQRHLSKNKFRVWQQADTEDLGSEDSQAVGEVVDSVYTDIVKHSSSGTSLYEDITNKNDDFVNQVACFVVSEISRRDFQSLSGSEDELCSPSAVIQLESERIVKKFLSDMDLGEAKDDLSEAHIPLVPVLFLEEILSRFLTTILLAQYDLGIHGKKSLSTTNVNEIVGLLKTSVEKEMSKNKIGLVASNDKPILDPEYEETVNQVVHSVISNVLEKSGSQKELYNDMTTRQVIFPEQVASIIINEISSCTVGKPLGENLENETFSALELDRIVSKVLARVSSHMEVEEDEAVLELSSPPETQEESTLDGLPQTGDVPIKIVPYIRNKPLEINPDIIADHLAVLSIKTEPLEKLKKACLSKTGMSLTELRRASASGKSLSSELPIEEDHKKKERRPSLDMAGRLGVKPKELLSACISPGTRRRPRGSSRSCLSIRTRKSRRLSQNTVQGVCACCGKPVQNAEELGFRLRTAKSMLEAPASSAGGWPLRQRRAGVAGLLRSCCCGRMARLEGSLPRPSLLPGGAHPSGDSQRDTTGAGGGAGLFRSRKGALPQASRKAGPTALLPLSRGRDPDAKAAVRCPPWMQGPRLWTCCKDQGENHGKVVATTSSEAHVPPRQRPSVVQKVSSALSRVFSRTSTSHLPAGQEKTAGERA